jgi:hypothetical protein
MEYIDNSGDVIIYKYKKTPMHIGSIGNYMPKLVD